MNWKPPERYFEVSWPTSTGNSNLVDYSYRNDEEKKRQFGLELAKGLAPFEAAINVFKTDTNAALWVSQNWLTDEIVLQVKNSQVVSAVNELEKLLDKDSFARKLLKFADEKDPSNKFFLHEARDRLAAYKLFAEVQGFVGKIAINSPTTNITNNKLEIVLVEPEKEQPETIVIDNQDEPDLSNIVELKLVEAS